MRARHLERRGERKREEKEKLLEGGQAGEGSATNEAAGESQVVRERGKGEVAKGRVGRRWQCNK